MKQGKVDVLKSLIEEARGRLEHVFETKRQLKHDLREETARNRQEGNKKKNNSKLNECKQRDKEYNCSQEIARVSQQLVMELVHRIEDDAMLKDGVYSENLKFGGCGSADNIVTTLQPNRQPLAHTGSNILSLFWMVPSGFPP